MAAGPTTVAATAVLDFLSGRTTPRYTAAKNTYLSLHSGEPTSVGNKEITTSGYARKQISWTAPSGSPTASVNTSQISFGPMNANMSVAATHAALVTSSSGTTGDLLYIWALPQSVTALNGETVDAASGSLGLAVTV